jgi:NUDIX domain
MTVDQLCLLDITPTLREALALIIRGDDRCGSRGTYRSAVHLAQPDKVQDVNTPEKQDWLRTRVYGERTVYDNRWVTVGLADVEMPDGQRVEHHVVHLDHVAIAVLLDGQDRVLMLWRYRFAVDQWGYELLGGLVKDGEDPVATAAREAEEESGNRPMGDPQHLSHFQPMPGWWMLQLTSSCGVILNRSVNRVTRKKLRSCAGFRWPSCRSWSLTMRYSARAL